MKTITVYSFLFIALSTISSAQWTQTNWTSSSTAVCLAGYDQYLFGGTDEEGVFMTNDNGTNWSPVNTGLTNIRVSSLAIAKTNTGIVKLYAGTRGGVFVSTNNGGNWTQIKTGLTDTTITCLNVYQNNTDHPKIFAGTYSMGIFMLNESGTAWIERNTNVTTKFILCMASNDSTILTGTDGGGVYISKDGGANWSASVSGLNTLGISAIGINNSFNIQRNYLTTPGGVLYQSLNSGASWDQTLTYNFPGSQVYSFVASGPYIFTGGTGGFIYYPLPSGPWTKDNTGISAANFRSLTVNNQYIFAGNFGNGVWKRPLSQIVTSATVNTHEVHSFQLSQNYPNPFNPSTSFDFTVPYTGKAVVQVHTILGEHVATLFDGNAEAGKTYSVHFSGERISSGIYVYSVHSGSELLHKKMILIK